MREMAPLAQKRVRSSSAACVKSHAQACCTLLGVVVIAEAGLAAPLVEGVLEVAIY